MNVPNHRLERCQEETTWKWTKRTYSFPRFRTKLRGSALNLDWKRNPDYVPNSEHAERLLRWIPSVYREKGPGDSCKVIIILSLFVFLVSLFPSSSLNMFCQSHLPFSTVQPSRRKMLLYSWEKDLVIRPRHVGKLPNLNFRREDLVEKLSTSLHSLLKRNVTWWMPCRLY